MSYIPRSDAYIRFLRGPGREGAFITNNSRERNMPRISLTHGILPTEEQFHKQFEAEVPHGVYRIRNHSGLQGDYNANELWRIVQKLERESTYADPEPTDKAERDAARQACEAADLDLSSILDTLGFDWV